MDGTEDFSFPGVTDSNYPRAIDSPPLWTLSPSSTSHNNNHPHQDFDEEKREEKLISQGQTESFKEDHKMDFLWEDFNEELSSSTGFASATSSSTEMVGEYGCGSTTTAVTAANTKGAALFLVKNYCKPGMVAEMNVLNKLFFFSDSQGTQPRRRRKVW